MSMALKYVGVGATISDKGSDGATTSDKCNFPLSWPVTGNSPSSVKGAL